MKKNGLIRKIRLVSKFMMLQPDYETIATYMSTNISGSKSNQAMKFVQFFKNHTESEAWRLVPDLFLFFRKVLF